MIQMNTLFTSGISLSDGGLAEKESADSSTSTFGQQLAVLQDVTTTDREAVEKEMTANEKESMTMELEENQDEWSTKPIPTMPWNMDGIAQLENILVQTGALAQPSDSLQELSAAVPIEGISHVEEIADTEQVMHITATEEELDNQLKQLEKQLDAILARVTTMQEALEHAPQLLQLLEQYSLLMQQQNALGAKSSTPMEAVHPNWNRPNEPIPIQIGPYEPVPVEDWADVKITAEVNREKVFPTQDTEEQAIREKLIHLFEKRSHSKVQQHYPMNAELTSKDIAKWLIHEMQLEPETITKPTEVTQPHAAGTVLPMSKLEQYVVHVQLTQDSPTVDKQLMSQFEKAIQTTGFLQSPGRSQLTIALNPGNLGDILIRFTEINGEMTVKMVVATAQAKEMLESNLHQLKHMFSPHQVVIERQEPTIQTTQEAQQEQADQSFEEQDQEHASESHSGHSHQEQHDFAQTFQEALDEKV